jgi:hypothetical protein
MKFELKTGNRVFLDGNELVLPHDNSIVHINIEQNRIVGQSFQRIHFKTIFGLHLDWTNDRGHTHTHFFLSFFCKT